MRDISRDCCDGNLHFSFSQFLILDKSYDHGGMRWTQLHLLQGFAKREYSLAISTYPVEFGIVNARLIFDEDGIALGDWDRIISVSLKSGSGALHILAPDAQRADFVFSCSPILRVTWYMRFAGDASNGFSALAIHICRSSELLPSVILKADGYLRPPTPLLESAEEP